MITMARAAGGEGGRRRRRQNGLHYKISADSLAEIATFLARRWSENDTITVEISDRLSEARTRLSDNRISIAPPERRTGDGFQRYRQFRTALWYESAKARHCKKILSNDHAFGFILNAMETCRIEHVGTRMWRGMVLEIMMYHAHMLVERPQLHEVYGRARIVEAFYQQLVFGAIKGELQASHSDRVARAAEFARGVISQAVAEDRDTDWTEKHVSKIIMMLDIDSLMTIPVSLPFMRAGMALDEKEMSKVLKIVSQHDKKSGLVPVADDSGADSSSDEYVSSILHGSDSIYNEYTMLLDENQRAENKGLASEPVGIMTPSASNANEASIYDAALINGLKARFKEWKSGWKETHVASMGDEFDEEAYIEGSDAPFISDAKRSIKTRITMLLDHSSSISADAKEYKKATLALCEVLAFLRVGFSVYAFSTQNRSVVCWSVKPEAAKWNTAAAKRLAQITANGSTPLAEVYDKMYPILQAKSPDIFLTLTDGEPSDPDAVRAMIKNLRGVGISMVALGLGPNVIRATTIANNLKRLGYEKTVAVSRLADIPNKVMGILEA